MAKLSLTIYGIPTDGGTSSGTEDVTMSLGDEKKEGTFRKKMTVQKENTDDDSSSSIETVEISLSPNHFNYQQKLYQPDELNIEIQISATTSNSDSKVSISKDDILDMFEDKKVSLTTSNNDADDSYTVGDDYYVFEVTCKKSSDATYANLKICSPDKLMTKKQNSQVWTAKKLYSDILTGDDGELQNYTLPYDSSSHVEVDTSNWKHLYANSQEHIFPYLVQYNESFYDLLARTTNRWGEFMYYYDGKLRIGYDDDESKAEEVDNYNSITYLDYTETTTTGKDYVTQAPDDGDVLNSHVTKDSYAIMMGTINTAFSSGGEMYWFMKVGQLLTTRHSLLNFLVDTIVMDVVIWLQMKVKNKQKNNKFNKQYFDEKEKKYVSMLDEQYDDDEETLNQFSEYEPVVDAKEYAKILVGEVVAGDNTIEIDYDTYAPSLHIGQLIKVDGNYYIVSEISSKEKEEVSLSVNKSTYEIEKTTITSQVFTVKALAKVEYTDSDDSSISLKGYYPAIIPSGHVRKAEPQQAMVVGSDDPQCNGRVRVMYPWQLADLLKEKGYYSIDQIQQSDLDDYDITNATPWIHFLQPTGNSMAGINAKHYLADHVMVNYTHGNVERPYVSGGIPKIVHPFLRDGGSCFIGSPNGEYIRVHEGENQGATAFLTNLSPGMSLISGFIDYKDAFGKDEVSQCFDGGISMGDRYGIWNIDCSTTKRSIKIMSPWGDIMMNAFTGLTLAAPNGDVRIVGKNVSIMAGNNLSLASGINIRNKFVSLSKNKDGDFSWSTLGKDIVKAIVNRLVELGAQICDLTIIRSIVEVFYKPEEGCLSIASGRYLKLQAGGAMAGYPAAAYENPKKKLEKLAEKDEKKAKKQFAKMSVETMNRMIRLVPKIVVQMCTDYVANYEDCIKKRAEFEAAYLALKLLSNEDNGFCKTYDDLRDTLWNPKTEEIKKDDMSFDDDKVGDSDGSQVDAKLVDRVVGVVANGPRDVNTILNAISSIRSERKTAKEDLLECANALLESIQKLRKTPTARELIKNYNASTFEKNLKVDKDYIEDFRDAFTAANLGETDFFKYAYDENNAITDERATHLPANANYKLFLNPNDFHATALKRQVILSLLETWGMESQAIKRKIDGNAIVDADNESKPSTPTTTADLEDNNKYELYVESLQLTNFKAEGEWSSWGSSLLDTLTSTNITALKSIGENHAWGNPRAGEILFGVGPTTMNLGKNGQISPSPTPFNEHKFSTARFTKEEKDDYDTLNDLLRVNALTAGE